MVTVAPGTTAPLGSVIVPVTSPDTTDWADVTPGDIINRNAVNIPAASRSFRTTMFSKAPLRFPSLICDRWFLAQALSPPGFRKATTQRYCMCVKQISHSRVEDVRLRANRNAKLTHSGERQAL